MTDTLLPVETLTTAAVPVTTPVTAVVVARGRTRYLATTLRALAAQIRRPTRVLLVDVGPEGGEPLGPVLDAAFASAPAPVPRLSTVRAPRARTFGDAVRTGLDALAAALDERPTAWLWLLHDDSAPAPEALARLVRTVSNAPSVVVAGCKQRTWTEPERLLELGVRTTLSGRRMTDVEPGELDQGQHDGRTDVLGVGLAGALVRRDVWDALGGTDPALGPYGDGLDLSRRARLAGHRVVVVPTAVVRHAQAAYHGLRPAYGGRAADHDAPEVDLDGDGEPDAADPTRSFVGRRRALLHSRLAGAPLPLVPLVAVVTVAAAVLRALGQVAAKRPELAVAELRAALAVLLRPRPVIRARRRARATRVVARRTLRPLQATWRDVWEQARDRRLARREVRRVVRAPSELELRELAGLATRRRVTALVVVGALTLLSAVALGPLVGTVVGGGVLVGDALARVTTGVGDLWVSATSGWVPGGLGAAGPADPLLLVVTALAGLLGGNGGAAVGVLLLGAVVLSGVGAWAAAGAATRSVGVRAWAAAAWAVAPALLLALGSGRLGAVVAHVCLPWVALGLVRAVGAQRVDQVLAGVETATRSDDDADADARAAARADAAARRHAGLVDDVDETGADARTGGGGAVESADATTRTTTTRTATTGTAATGAGAAEADVTTPVRGIGVVPTPRGALASAHPHAGVDVPLAADAARHERGTATAPDVAHDVDGAARPAAHGGADAASGPDVDGGPDASRGPATTPGAPRLVGAPDPTGSLTAAAGAALALAVAVAAAPVLLVPATVLIVVVAVSLPRSRARARGRVLGVLVPGLVLLAPLLIEAVARGWDGVRLLLADPGPAAVSDPASPLARLLGVPADATSLVPAGLPPAVASAWPYLGGGAILALALLGLLRGRAVARGVRLCWVVAAVGLATGAAVAAVPAAFSSETLGPAWTGAAVSLATLGLLGAAVLATDGLADLLAARAFGWRQPVVVLVTVVAVVAVAAGAVGWGWTARSGDAVALRASTAPVVPVVGQQGASSGSASRVLALGVATDGAVEWSLLRADGDQQTDHAAAVALRHLTGPLGAPSARGDDPADAEVAAVAARLAQGAAGDVAPDLGALAVADVLVPGVPADDAAARGARARLVAVLDATAGLERVTHDGASTLWRVRAAEGQVVTSWARLLEPGADPADPSAVSEPVEAHGRTVDAAVAPGDGPRVLVLAERSDPAWRATLDGRELEAVDVGWRQAFEVGSAGGTLTVRYEPTYRLPWLAVLSVTVLVTCLLALPFRRRRGVRT